MLAFTNERLFEPKPCSLCGSVSEVTHLGRGSQHAEIEATEKLYDDLSSLS
jgi:hypothetical protein